MSDMTLKELLNTAKVLRDDKRALEKDVTIISVSLEEIKQQIRIKMHAEGIERTAVDGITVSLSDATVYNVADYSLFQEYILESGHTHLLQKRVANLHVKELMEDPRFLEKYKTVPGLVAFEKQNVNLRVS
jgi:hypothetical protein|tara:strand:- start:518 stop:910 length:393 start_codon:yes stop_codon:yes gene_type:complete